jgi:SAM-dependent methyltransferase
VVGVSDAIVWHDVENGGYDADLPLWRELARQAGGPILDLGAGTGRVALDLAEAGYDVTALDSDQALLGELARRAAERDLDVGCIPADARRFAAIGRYALVIAPMQFVQIMGGPSARSELLAAAVAALRRGGTFAAAIADLDEAVAVEDPEPPLPDVDQRGGWIYSSLPLDVRPEPGGVAVEWLRQKVSPAGTLTEERHTQMLDSLDAGEFEREAARHGLIPMARHEVSPTRAYIGSTVIVCRL